MTEEQRILDARLRAVAKALTSLADGLAHATGTLKDENAEIRGALVELIAGVSDIRSHLDPASLSVEELASIVPHRTICAVRQLQYQRQLSEGRGEPEPLPPPPFHDDHRREPTGVFALRHSDGTQRELHRVIGASFVYVVKKGWMLIPGGGIGWLLTHILGGRH